MTEETKEPVELSKEELAERRKEITDYYKENIKHLKIQLEYEELLMSIEKTRAERIQAQMFLAQATMNNGEGGPMAGMDFEQAKEGIPSEGADFDIDKKRTLKREA